VPPVGVRVLREAAALLGGTAITINKHRKIEADLTSDLTAAYCGGAAGCSPKAIITRVNADGTMTLAV
jgi:hypothetical protein